MTKKPLSNARLCEMWKGWLLRRKPGDYRPASEHYGTFRSMVHRHPRGAEKYRDFVGVRLVHNVSRYNLVPELFLIFPDETTEDISWRKCVLAKETVKDLFTKAMREAINYQIVAYRDAHPVRECSWCHSKYRVEVDHVRPFKDLMQDFLDTKDALAVPQSFQSHSRSEEDKSRINVEFKDEDQQFKNDWVQYHLKHADLRYLCQRCNVGRNRKAGSATFNAVKRKKTFTLAT